MHPHSFIKSSVLLSAAGVLAAGALLMAQAQQEHPTTYARADIEYGARVYAGQCVTCHGSNGDGVPGADLKGGTFRNASTDFELNRLLNRGIGTMPAMKLDSGELTAIVAYLRNMNTVDNASIKAGDPKRGQGVVSGKAGCLTCHSIDGTGALGAAPDLSDVGGRRSAGYLQRTLVDPDSQMLPINRPVRAVTRDGKVITGRRLNESTYSVQLINEQGRLVSLIKADLGEYSVLTKSPMPSFQSKLTSDEMADVLSYLLSLKGQ